MGRDRKTVCRAGVLAFVLGVAGCGGGGRSEANPSSLAGRPALSVTPPAGRVGTTFQLRATAMKPGQAVVFEIAVPPGRVLKSKAPRLVGSDGTVTATFASTDRPPGIYRVKGIGDKGESVGALFEVLTPVTSTTTGAAPSPASTGAP